MSQLHLALLAVSLLLLLICGGESQAQPAPSAGLGLVYSADVPGEICPDEAWLRRQIEAHAGRAVLAPPEREGGAVWVLARRVDRVLRIDVMLRTPAGVKGLRSFESDTQSCVQLMEAASLSLSIAVMDALSPRAGASSSAAPAAPPVRAASSASVAPAASSAAPAAPAATTAGPLPRSELALGPAVVSGWSPSFTGAAVLGWAHLSGWSSAGIELRLLPPKRQGEGASEIEVQSLSVLAIPCARVDALGFCGVVLGGAWSGGPVGAAELKGVVGAGGQIRADGSLSERVGIRAFAEILAPLRRPTFRPQDGEGWRLPAASVSVGTLLTFSFL